MKQNGRVNVRGEDRDVSEHYLVGPEVPFGQLHFTLMSQCPQQPSLWSRAIVRLPTSISGFLDGFVMRRSSTLFLRPVGTRGRPGTKRFNCYRAFKAGSRCTTFC
jgi:hypothetical protein